MIQKILVPIDGSELSERVFPWVRYLAKGLNSEVTLFRSFEPPHAIYFMPELIVPSPEMLSEENIANQVLAYLDRKVNQLSELQVNTHLACGEAGDEILKHSQEFDLIVMASHGRGGLGRWLLGSVATKVVRASSKPVFVVSGKRLAETERTPEIGRILVALDGSELAEKALDRAVKLASAFSAELILYQSVSIAEIAHPAVIEINQRELSEAQSYLDGLKSKHEPLVTHTIIHEAHPARGIVDVAADRNADIVVMGSHGRSGINRWLLGSVAESVIQNAPCPILIEHETKPVDKPA